MTYSARPKQRKILKIVTGVMVGLLVFGVVAVWWGYSHYQQQLEPVSSLQADQTVTIVQGATAQQVAREFEQLGLIRSSWAFEVYMRQNNLRSLLRSGTYALSPHMSVPMIAEIVTSELAVERWVTIAPERRLDQIRADLINRGGFDPDDVDAALDPALYDGHPALAQKPAGASLEGYLYPETFQADATTTAQDIITLSLDQMASNLTPQIRQGIAAQGLTLHEGIILASIVEREVDEINPDDRPRVAQVFLLRLADDMKLQSNATTFYGAVISGEQATYEQLGDVRYDTPYNTYQNAGLPPSPVSNVSRTSLEAVASPAATDYLYFVSGDRDEQGVSVTHFSRTLDEHERNIQLYCTTLCGR